MAVPGRKKSAIPPSNLHRRPSGRGRRIFSRIRASIVVVGIAVPIIGLAINLHRQTAAASNVIDISNTKSPPVLERRTNSAPNASPPVLERRTNSAPNGIKIVREGNNNTTRYASVDLVIAHYKEWLDHSTGNIKNPEWADQSNERQINYRIHPLYQRLDQSQPRYVPNNGYESGVYLKYVVDNYHNLPEISVFVQADACKVDMGYAMGQLTSNPQLVRDAGGFLPLNSNHIDRGVSYWYKWRGEDQGNRVETCWRRLAFDFDRGDVVPNATVDEFKVRGICCACLAVSRERIHRIPYATWTKVYERTIVKGECIAGRLDLDQGKHETGGAFEHLAHVIWGGHDAYWATPVYLGRPEVLRPARRKEISLKVRGK